MKKEAKTNNLLDIFNDVKKEMEYIKSLRNKILKAYEQLSENIVDDAVISLMDYINSINKNKFGRRPIISYMPIFEDIYYSKIELLSQEFKNQEKEILKIKNKIKTSIFQKKYSIDKIGKIIDESKEYLNGLDEKLSNIKIRFSKSNRCDASKKVTGIIKFKTGLENEIKNLLDKIKNEKEKIKVYEKLINNNLNIWLKLYKNLANFEDNLENRKRKIKMFLDYNIKS